MQNFAEQCLDMAKSILGQNLSSINEDGTISPIEGEESRVDEPGHAALALGEFYRATGEAELEGLDIVDLAARCITQAAFSDEQAENGIGFSSLGLLSFGPAKDRNPVWERLLDPTREELDRLLLIRSDYTDHSQAFNIGKAVARFSMGLSKKDETGKLIDRFIERIEQNSSTGFCDDNPSGESGLVGGTFDIYGIMSFVFIRQALQLHSNIHLRERKLPTLRTFSEKYIKLLPDMVRQDGMGFNYGHGIGAYGQMHCLSILLQAFRDGWISDNQRSLYGDLVKKLFFFFYVTYLDQDNGYLVIRDEERTTIDRHTTRMANFDAARYLCQWYRLGMEIGGSSATEPIQPRKVGRFSVFDKSHRKEQGVFLYQDPDSGLSAALPLVSAAKDAEVTGYLAFPHSPGIFDFPANAYLPIMVPELTFGDQAFVPCFYGKRCVTSLGLRKAVVFKYEQPELINTRQKVVSGIGSCKVTWTFRGNAISSEFVFTVKNQIQLERMRYVLAIGSPHTRMRIPMTYTLGPESLRASVTRDDFLSSWSETEVVTHDPDYRGYQGNIHYLQVLERNHPLIMRPGQQYRLIVEFEPDIAFADE